MRERGIAGICPGPHLSKRPQKEGIFPSLLRHTTSHYPHHIWGLDITYIRLKGGWMYLVAVRDWYSRSVLSGEVDARIGMALCLDGTGTCSGSGHSTHLQERSGEPLHQPTVSTSPAIRSGANTYGWKRTSTGQHFYRKAVANDEI